MVAHSILHNVGGVVTRLEPGVGFEKKPTVTLCSKRRRKIIPQSDLSKRPKSDSVAVSLFGD
jgi:hypothetical protein